MNTKHTKGPWHYNGLYVLSPTGTPIVGELNNEADAELIAAAPEMLAALTKVSIDGMTENTMRAVYAAIRKAEGKD